MFKNIEGVDINNPASLDEMARRGMEAATAALLTKTVLHVIKKNGKMTSEEISNISLGVLNEIKQLTVSSIKKSMGELTQLLEISMEKEPADSLINKIKNK